MACSEYMTQREQRKRPLSQAGAAAIAREVAAKAAAPLAKDPTVATALPEQEHVAESRPKRASFGKQLRSSSTATDLD